MIYLLSEMILALAVAVVLGIAVGWVIHRSTYSAQTQRLKHGMARKNAQLAHARSELGMLNDDYNDMHRKSQEQIDVLREQNKQIPTLNSNLEKSQLLVRQMMQRHEAKVRDLSSENQLLLTRLEQVDEQEQTKNQLAAKLDERKRSSAKDTSVTESADAAITDDHVVKTDISPTATTHQETTITGKADSLFVAAEADDDPFDKVIEVADEMQRDLDLTTEQKVEALTDQTLGYAEETDDMDAVYELSGIDDLTDDTAKTTDLDSTLMFANELDASDDLSERTSNPSGSDTQRMNAFTTDEQQGADELAESTYDNELPLDGSSDAAQLFDPVDRHDDLQQIFGIGPLTEKALNDLGITSYSQLAELKQHDIQRIADALEIGQGRIERDNWVGNARRQLEEVLEQL